VQVVVDLSIFKGYDVRGSYPDQMDEALAYRIGRAFTRVLSELEGTPQEELQVAVGRDMRLSAAPMAERYTAGIADEGADVLDVGMAATEMVYWTVGARELQGGLVCTASPNPKAYTGAKLVKRGAIALSSESGIGELREIVADGAVGPPPGDPAEVRREDVGEAFREAVLGYIDPERIRPLKVVLDGGMAWPAPGGSPLRLLPDRAGEGRIGSRRRVPPTTSRTRCSQRIGSSSLTRCGRPVPTWASRGTATLTAVSSSTTRASSCRGTF